MSRSCRPPAVTDAHNRCQELLEEEERTVRQLQSELAAARGELLESLDGPDRGHASAAGEGTPQPEHSSEQETLFPEQPLTGKEVNRT